MKKHKEKAQAGKTLVRPNTEVLQMADYLVVVKKLL
jgi:hypothetical protein